MSSFEINPNFSTQNFDNSIKEFNNNFSTSLNQINNNFNEAGNNFGEIFNSMTPKKVEPLKAGTSAFVGMDSIAAQKISPVQQLAQDIGSGLSNSIGELNTVSKQAETDFETFASGGDISVHDVMISAQKSNLAMQMAIQLRNQVLNAYNEFKNMSV